MKWVETTMFVAQGIPRSAKAFNLEIPPLSVYVWQSLGDDPKWYLDFFPWFKRHELNSKPSEAARKEALYLVADALYKSSDQFERLLEEDGL
jgi:hypothetical protein